MSPALELLEDDAPLYRDPAVRTQLALVRTLAAELNRRLPTYDDLAPLRAQLTEELERLARLLGPSGSMDSGVYRRPSTEPQK